MWYAVRNAGFRHEQSPSPVKYCASAVRIAVLTKAKPLVVKIHLLNIIIPPLRLIYSAYSESVSRCFDKRRVSGLTQIGTVIRMSGVIAEDCRG
jgi:hypothetical protein